jgi:hypothetical protein
LLLKRSNSFLLKQISAMDNTEDNPLLMDFSEVFRKDASLDPPKMLLDRLTQSKPARTLSDVTSALNTAETRRAEALSAKFKASDSRAAAVRQAQEQAVAELKAQSDAKMSGAERRLNENLGAAQAKAKQMGQSKAELKRAHEAAVAAALKESLEKRISSALERAGEKRAAIQAKGRLMAESKAEAVRLANAADAAATKAALELRFAAADAQRGVQLSEKQERASAMSSPKGPSRKEQEEFEVRAARECTSTRPAACPHVACENRATPLHVPSHAARPSFVTRRGPPQARLVFRIIPIPIFCFDPGASFRWPPRRPTSRLALPAPR